MNKTSSPGPAFGEDFIPLKDDASYVTSRIRPASASSVAAASSKRRKTNSIATTSPVATKPPTPGVKSSPTLHTGTRLTETKLKVANLPESATSKSLEEFFSTYGPIKRVYVITPKGSNKCSGTGYVHFSVASDADAAAKAAHGKKFEGRKLFVGYAKKRTAKPRVEGSKTPTPKGVDENDDSDYDQEAKGLIAVDIKRVQTNHTALKTRIIVRNIPFQWKQKDITSFFSTFGKVKEVNLPTNSTGVPKGFAFVQYFSPQAAISEANEKSVQGRTISIALAVPKSEYEDSHRAKSKPVSVSQGSTKKKDSFHHEQEIVEVEEEEQEHPENVVQEENEDEDENENEEEEEEEEEKDIEEKASLPKHELTATQLKKRQKRNAKEIQSTIFIRNLSFNTTEDDLTERFEQYGEIRYCTMPMDEKKNRSRGCAFLCFDSPDAVLKVMAEAYPAYASTQEGDSAISMDGRSLVITRAVPKGDADKLTKEKKQKKEKEDKRNMHLARIGYISREEAKDMGLSEEDIRKRAKTWDEKNSKLKNVNFFVSPTRLSVRNLPLSVDEKALRELVSSNMAHPKAIRKILIIRDPERCDASGLKRSRGFGFIDFSEHEDALNVLNFLNNNPDVFGKNRRPIVGIDNTFDIILNVKDFAVENVQAVAKMNRIIERGKRLSLEAKKKREQDGEVAEPKMSRTKRRIMKRNAKREAKRSHKNEENLEGAAATATVVTRKRASVEVPHKRTSVEVSRKRTSAHSLLDDIADLPTEDQPPSKKRRRGAKGKEKSEEEEKNFRRLLDKYKQRILSDTVNGKNIVFTE